MDALACAAKMHDRLRGVACVSPAAPLDAPSVTVPGATGALVRLGQCAPWALWAVYAVLVPWLRRKPERIERLFASGLGAADREVEARPEIQRVQAAMLLEAFRSGYWGEVREVVIASRPWGISLEHIPIVVHLWDGDQNTLVPPSHSAYLAHTMPAAQMHSEAGGNYVLIVDHMEEILCCIAAD